LLGSLDAAVNIDAIVIVLDWGLPKISGIDLLVNSAELARFSRGTRNVRQERGLTPKGDCHEICQLHCRNSDACSRRLCGPVLPALWLLAELLLSVRLKLSGDLQLSGELQLSGQLQLFVQLQQIDRLGSQLQRNSPWAGTNLSLDAMPDARLLRLDARASIGSWPASPRPLPCTCSAPSTTRPPGQCNGVPLKASTYPKPPRPGATL
jgi:hypothetical protein